MSLGRVTTWVAGQVLTANALNGEFNNVLQNPITLISPTTSPINFNLVAHTNLLPSVISATSGTVGQAIVTTGGAPVWGSPTVALVFTSFTSGQIPVGTSSGGLAAINIGSANQLLIVTSSNSTPIWRSLVADGGLSTVAPSVGAIYFISTDGNTILPLAIGTSGQQLQVSTALKPAWVTAGAAATGTVKAALRVVSSGNLSVSSTSFVSLLPATISLTPATTAPRFLMNATFSVLTSQVAGSTNTVSFTFLIDGVVQGGADGIMQHNLAGVDGGIIGVSLSDLSSVLTTGAHTFDLDMHNSAGGNTHLVLRGDPQLHFMVTEIATTG